MIMKIEKTVKVTKCDLCGNVEEKNWGEFLWTEYQCLGCGKDICTDCIDGERAIKYNHAVHLTGSEDGVYCRKCNSSCAHTDLHKTYHAIAKLRQAEKEFCEDFRKRCDAVEEKLKKLRSQSEDQVATH